MPRWIALFRGINVGGNNRLSMSELVRNLESLQCKNVGTYIQSGNAVFDSTAKSAKSLLKKITARIKQQHGFAPHVLLITLSDLQKAIDANPFPQAISDPKSLHFFFLERQPTKPNLQAIEQAKAASEAYKLTNSVFYLHAPDGIGRSKLAAAVEKHLGVAATARNYRTVEKLAALAGQD